MLDETKNTNDKHHFGMWLIEEYGIEYLHELYIYLAQIKDYELFITMYDKCEDDEDVICSALYVIMRFKSLYSYYEEYRKKYDKNVMTFGAAMKIVIEVTQRDKRLDGIVNNRLIFKNNFYAEMEEFYGYMYKAEHSFIPGV